MNRLTDDRSAVKTDPFFPEDDAESPPELWPDWTDLEVWVPSDMTLDLEAMEETPC